MGKAFKTLTISSSVGTSVDKSEEVTAKTGIKKIIPIILICWSDSPDYYEKKEMKCFESHQTSFLLTGAGFGKNTINP